MFWQPPRTHGEVVEGRSVSFLELFYDLVYVVLIARLASTLAHHISWQSVGEFAVLFAMIWIGWFNWVTYHDAHGRGDARTRSVTFAQMFATAAMAVFAGSAAGTGGTGFAISYTVFLAILVWLWWSIAIMERGDEQFGNLSRTYSIVMTVMALWIVTRPDACNHGRTAEDSAGYAAESSGSHSPSKLPARLHR